MINVLIVDDSSTSRLLLRNIIEAAPDMQVVGELFNGQQAVEQVPELRPDVILMDIVMPRMDGMQATASIMASSPTPIVMVSATIEGRETEMAFQAIKKGALTLLSKPVGPNHPAFEEQATRLANTVRAMAGVRVIHHVPKRQSASAQERPERSVLQQTLGATPEIIGIVASTGGPAALSEIVQQLPADFSIPIVIVQHIAQEFFPSLLSWLDRVSALPIHIAEAGQPPQHGITFAPIGQHLYIDKRRRFAFTDTPLVAHMPAGNILLESIAEHYGMASVGVVLTGMGDDGADGLFRMYRRGAVTIAQNQKTSAVYGMPKEAKDMGAVKYELGLSFIGPMLRDLEERETQHEESTSTDRDR